MLKKGFYGMVTASHGPHPSHWTTSYHATLHFFIVFRSMPVRQSHALSCTTILACHVAKSWTAPPLPFTRPPTEEDTKKMKELVQKATIKFQSTPYECEWLAFDAFSDKMQYSVSLHFTSV